MPEFGVLFKIDADYDTVEWYGNGPAAVSYTHLFDDTRLVPYEGVVNDPRFLKTTDIDSHMYSLSLIHISSEAGTRNPRQQLVGRFRGRQ